MQLLERAQVVPPNLPQAIEKAPRLEHIPFHGPALPQRRDRTSQPILLNASRLSDLEAARAVIATLPDHHDLVAIDVSQARAVDPRQRIQEMTTLAKRGGLLRPVYGQDVATGQLQLTQPDDHIDFRDPEAVIVIDQADVAQVSFKGLPEALTPHVRKIRAFAVPEGFQPLENIE